MVGCVDQAHCPAEGKGSRSKRCGRASAPLLKSISPHDRHRLAALLGATIASTTHHDPLAIFLMVMAMGCENTPFLREGAFALIGLKGVWIATAVSVHCAA